jgi:hypothetical protein
VEGEKLKDVLRVLKEGLGFKIYVFYQVMNGVLEMSIHNSAQFTLNNGCNLVILFQSEHNLTNFVDPGSIGSSLELPNCFQNILSLLIESKRALQFME